MKSIKGIMCCFLVIVALMTACNISLIITPVTEFSDGTIDFTAMRDKIQTTYKSDEVSFKNSFVNLNGLFSRLIGKRVINETVVLNNGMLNHETVRQFAVDKLALEISAFSDVLEGMKIPFVYVQAPYKMDWENTLLPTGTTNLANANAEQLLVSLRNLQTQTLDLRILNATVEDVERNFYRTDHHWNTEGAFSGYQMIAKCLQEVFDDSTAIELYINHDNWERHEIKDIFLGSQGKRVGKYVTGVDDLVYYTPSFDTKMLCSIPKNRVQYKGDFADAVIRDNHTKNEKGFFKSNAYCVYIGGDYPLVHHRNEQAPIKKKVLLLKDSYMLAVQSFLSTVYEEIDVIDPRHFKECSIVEYVLRTQPDAVLMMMNPTLFPEASRFNYGNTDWDRKMLHDANILLDDLDLKINASTNSYKYECIFEGFQPDTAYTFTFENASVLEGEAQSVVCTLYDPVKKVGVSSGIFDIEYCRSKNKFQWMFRTPKEDCANLQLLVYSGQPGNTQGVSVAYAGIKLYQGYKFNERN